VLRPSDERCDAGRRMHANAARKVESCRAKNRYVAQQAHKCGATRRAQVSPRSFGTGRDTLPYKEQQSALRSGNLHETAIVMRMFAKKIALIGVPFMVLLGPPP
jgi:hypothetical protein